MGARLSSINPNPKSTPANPHDPSQSNESCKRQRTSANLWDENPRLIPSLPDEISLQILARVPLIFHLSAKLVSRSWKSALTSSDYYRLRKELGTTEEWLYILTRLDGKRLVWHALDPVTASWQRLPLMPNVSCGDEMRRDPYSFQLWNILGSSVITDAIRGWLGRKELLEEIPFCGCSIGAVGGCLYVIGGFCRASAVKTVWRYEPVTNSWAQAPPMSVGRAYCKTGVLNGKLYVVGGVMRGRGGLTPLHSAEAYDPCTGLWAEVPSMPFSKARILPVVFLADILKPIATGMTCYKGKLYVPQSLYCWPFFVDVGGEVYDPDLGLWAEMPVGMGDGWPAKQTGTKLSAVVDGELYSLDPSSSLDSARIKVYDYEEDSWKVIEGEVPVCDLADSESPYLLAGFLGKLHMITRDADRNILVMQADRRNGPHPGLSDGPSAPSGSMWRVIASKSSSGSAELVSCQILDL